MAGKNSKSTGKLVMGLDVGGTKTACVIMDDRGVILGRATGGSGNTNFIPLQVAKESFRNAVEGAAKQAKIARLKCAAVVVATEPSPKPVAPLIRKLSDCASIEHRKEGESSMVGGLVTKVGLSLICGTGSVGWGRNARGRTDMTSCWGPIGDEDAAYWIATQGVNAAFWAWDRRGEKTILCDMMLKMLKVTEPRGVPTPLYAGDNVRKNIASLSRMVTDAANQGDKVARDILKEGAWHIAYLLTTCAKNLKMGDRPYQIAATGGLVADPKSRYFKLIESELRKIQPKAQLVPPKFEPVIGSCLIALDLIGIEWTPQLVKRTEKSWKATARRQ